MTNHDRSGAAQLTGTTARPFYVRFKLWLVHLLGGVPGKHEVDSGPHPVPPTVRGRTIPRFTSDIYVTYPANELFISFLETNLSRIVFIDSGIDASVALKQQFDLVRERELDLDLIGSGALSGIPLPLPDPRDLNLTVTLYLSNSHIPMPSTGGTGVIRVGVRGFFEVSRTFHAGPTTAYHLRERDAPLELRVDLQNRSGTESDNLSDDDRAFMRLAVDEAHRSVIEDGGARPFVGAVVVKDGRLLATAHRGEHPKNHAEYVALEMKLRDVPLHGATVYTTLEPCTQRNQPKVPCAARLVERRVARVFIGMLDPNPVIQGEGYNALREANIDVQLFPSDLMRELEELNREFIRHHRALPKRVGFGLPVTSSDEAEQRGDEDWTTLVGSYRFENGNLRNLLSITRVSRQSLRFSIEAWDVNTGASGSLEEEALIQGNAATFRSRDGAVKLNFEDGRIRVGTDGATRCGIGVYFDGIYMRDRTGEVPDPGRAKIITVSDAAEFVNGIEPGVHIRLKKGIYNLSTVVGMGTANVVWLKEFDGYGARIENCNNLTIEGEDGVLLLVEPRYVFVLSFLNCHDIAVKSITLGHSPSGSCMGGVVLFEKCSDVRMTDARLYGCGTVGIEIVACARVEVDNTEIKECTSQLLRIQKSQGVTFLRSTLRETHGWSELIEIRESSAVRFVECTIRNNRTQQAGSLFEVVGGCNDVRIERSSVKWNAVANFTSDRQALTMIDCELVDNAFEVDGVSSMAPTPEKEFSFTHSGAR